MRSPLTLEVLLAFNTGHPVAYFGASRWAAPAVQDAIAWLEKNDLIIRTAQAPHTTGLTAKGEAWLNAMVNLPLPQQHTTWRVPITTAPSPALAGPGEPPETNATRMIA